MKLRLKKNIRIAGIIRLSFAVGLLIGALIRLLRIGGVDGLTIEESFVILMLFIAGVHFLHSGIATNLEDRIKALEQQMKMGEAKA